MAARGPVVVLFFDDGGGQLVMINCETRQTRLTSMSREMGLFLIHPKLDVLIFFRFKKEHATRPSRPDWGRVENLHMFYFSDRGIKAVDRSKHISILRQFGHRWYRPEMLQDPFLGPAAAFLFVNEGQSLFYCTGDSTCVSFSGTTVYVAKLGSHMPTRIAVKDLAAEVPARETELLEYCNDRGVIDIGPVVRTALDLATVRSKLYGDGRYVVEFGPHEFHAWSLEEDIMLAGEDPNYYRIRMERAHVRVMRARQRRSLAHGLFERKPNGILYSRWTAFHQKDRLDKGRRRWSC